MGGDDEVVIARMDLAFTEDGVLLADLESFELAQRVLTARKPAGWPAKAAQAGRVAACIRRELRARRNVRGEKVVPGNGN